MIDQTVGSNSQENHISNQYRQIPTHRVGPQVVDLRSEKKTVKVPHVCQRSN